MGTLMQKLLFWLVLLSVLFYVANVASAAEAPQIPREVLQTWEYFIGNWKLDGQVGERRVSGIATYSWAKGHHCYLGKQEWQVDGMESPLQLTSLLGWDAETKETLEQGFSSSGEAAKVRYATNLHEPKAKQTTGKAVGVDARGRWEAEVTIDRKSADEFTITTLIDGEVLHQLTYRRVPVR